MARLQKKHSSKEKKKTKNSAENTEISKPVISGTKTVASSLKKGKPIKSSNSSKEKKDNIFKQGIEYLQEVQSELKKVTWPTRKQTLGTTLVVIVLVAIVSIFLGLFDYGFSQLIHAVLA